MLFSLRHKIICSETATPLGIQYTLIAFFIHACQKQQGHMPVPVPHIEEHLPESILAVFTVDEKANESVMHSAIRDAHGSPLVFLYLAQPKHERVPRLFEYHNPYHDDGRAKKAFGKAKHLAKQADIDRQFVYKQQERGTLEHIWQVIHPRETIFATGQKSQIKHAYSGSIQVETTPHGELPHLRVE